MFLQCFCTIFVPKNGICSTKMSIYICLVSVFSEENKNGVSSTLGMSWRHKWRDIFFLNPEQSRAFFFKDCNTPLMLLMKQQTRILRSLPLPGPYSVIGARKHLFSDTKQSIWKMYWNPHRLQWWNLLSGTKSAPLKKKIPASHKSDSPLRFFYFFFLVSNRFADENFDIVLEKK